jgi:hypothetical protein
MSGHITRRNVTTRGTYMHQWRQLQGTAPFQYVLCWSLYASVRSSLSFCAIRNMNGAGYLDTLDEFLMPVRFWKKCVPVGCTLHIGWHFLIQSFLANGMEDVTLSHRHPILLTLKPLTYSSGSTYKMLFSFHNCPTLCRNLLRGYGLLQLQLHPLHSLTWKLLFMCSPCITEYDIM